MKKIATLILLAAFLATAASAQNTGNKKRKPDTKATAKKQVKKKRSDTTTNTISITSTSANSAYSTTSGQQLEIADPTIKALNQNAAGADRKLSGSGIVGMPKGTYGFSNGRILFRTTTATSPGTGYGSGGVATGTSINSIGTSEATIGVNGKSPYAGTWLWGSKQPVYTAPLKMDTLRSSNKQ